MSFEKKYQSKKHKMHVCTFIIALGLKSTSLWDLVHATFHSLGGSTTGPSCFPKAAFNWFKETPLPLFLGAYV